MMEGSYYYSLHQRWLWACTSTQILGLVSGFPASILF